MNAHIDQVLSQAYDMIEQERLEEARRLLKPALDSHKDNADVWWLYAHAVTDAETARLALNNVIRLDPDYPNANDLLNQLDDRLVSDIRSIDDSPLRDPSFLPPLPSTLPGLPKGAGIDDEDEWDLPDEDEDEEADESKPIYQQPIFLLVMMLLVFAIVAALVILRPGEQQPVAQTATQASALNPTLDTTFTFATTMPFETPASEFTPTEELAEGEGDFSALYAALDAYNIPANGIRVEDTNLGSRTLLIDVCTTAGAELRTTLPAIMNTAALSGVINDDFDALAARMLDCNDNTDLLIVGTNTQNVIDYTTDNLSREEFEARWQPVNLS